MASDRRQFFRHLVKNVVGAAEGLLGAEKVPLSEIDTLPARELGRIIPVIVRQRVDRIRGGIVYATQPDGERAKSVGSLNPTELQIFSRFAGRKTLDQISHWASENLDLAPEEAFQISRDVFIRFCKSGILQPLNRES